jgi:hypothetical protein
MVFYKGVTGVNVVIDNLLKIASQAVEQIEKINDKYREFWILKWSHNASEHDQIDSKNEQISVARREEKRPIHWSYRNQINEALTDLNEQEVKDVLISVLYEFEGHKRRLNSKLELRDHRVAKLEARLWKKKNDYERALEKVQDLRQKNFEKQQKLFQNMQARRRGADKLHVENRAMKLAVFQWLDTENMSNKSNEAVGALIIKQQPIVHRTAVTWYKEWKKLRSASTL